VVHTGQRWFNAQVLMECADCQTLVVGKARLLRIGRWRHGDEAVTENALADVDERAPTTTTTAEIYRFKQRQRRQGRGRGKESRGGGGEEGGGRDDSR
jgi:hypothetical protein